MSVIEIVTTSQGAFSEIEAATLPISALANPVLPCDPITIRSMLRRRESQDLISDMASQVVMLEIDAVDAGLCLVEQSLVLIEFGDVAAQPGGCDE